MGTPDDIFDDGEIGQRSNVKDQTPANFNYPSVKFKEASIGAHRIDNGDENEINQEVDQLIQDGEQRQT
eukprot:10908-Pleurochrysis_carterae.AAC.1